MVKYDPPSEEVLEKYYEELGLTEKSIVRDVATLRSWVEKQPHLPDNVEDEMLEKFLVHSKNSLERAKYKLDNYYSARAKMADIFHDRDPLDPAIEVISQVAMYCVCPKTTSKGERVTISKLFDPDIKKFNVISNFKVAMMMLDAHLPEDLCLKHILIFDFDGCTMSHAAAITFPVIRKSVTLCLEVLPQRFSAMYAINVSSHYVTLFNFCKGLLSRKLAKRVFMLGNDMSSLHKYVDKDILPPEYGGSYPKSMEDLRAMAYQSLVERRGWFLKQNTIQADLNKLPLRKRNLLNNCLDGSFRKIDVD